MPQENATPLPAPTTDGATATTVRAGKTAATFEVVWSLAEAHQSNEALAVAFDSAVAALKSSETLLPVTAEWRFAKTVEIAGRTAGELVREIACILPAWPTLAERIASEAFSAADAAGVVARIADHCAELQAAGLPQNILRPDEIHLDPAVGSAALWLQSPLRSVVADVAAAQPGAQDATERLELADLRRAAPEHLQTNVGAPGRSQIWTLGVLLFELIAGSLPFDGSSVDEISFAIFAATPDLLLASGEPMPECIAEVLNCCLEADEVRRYPTTGALAAALRTASDKLTYGSELAAQVAAKAARSIAPPAPPEVAQELASGPPVAHLQDSMKPTAPPAGPPANRGSGTHKLAIDLPQMLHAAGAPDAIPTRPQLPLTGESNDTSSTGGGWMDPPELVHAARKAIQVRPTASKLQAQRPSPGARATPYLGVSLIDIRAALDAADARELGIADARTTPPKAAAEGTADANSANTLRPVKAASALESGDAQPAAANNFTRPTNPAASIDADDERYVDRSTPPSRDLWALRIEAERLQAQLDREEAAAAAAAQPPQRSQDFDVTHEYATLGLEPIGRQSEGRAQAAPENALETAPPLEALEREADDVVQLSDPPAAPVAPPQLSYEEASAVEARNMLASFADGIGDALGIGALRGALLHVRGGHQLLERDPRGDVQQTAAAGFSPGVTKLQASSHNKG